MREALDDTGASAASTNALTPTQGPVPRENVATMSQDILFRISRLLTRSGSQETCRGIEKPSADRQELLRDAAPRVGRGTNESTNGLLRQYLPKRRSMARLTQRDCNRIARQLNRRPRKRLGYRTPEECYAR